MLLLRVYGTAPVAANRFRDRSGLFTRPASGRDPRHEVDLVLHGVEDVLADEPVSLGRVIAEPAAQGTGGRQTPRDGDGEPALGADKRTVGEHLGAVAHEPPVLTE
jgi:hypothetical protein